MNKLKQNQLMLVNLFDDDFIKLRFSARFTKKNYFINGVYNWNSFEIVLDKNADIITVKGNLEEDDLIFISMFIIERIKEGTKKGHYTEDGVSLYEEKFQYFKGGQYER